MSDDQTTGQELTPNQHMENVLEKSRANTMAVVGGIINPETFAECVLYADYMSKSQIAVREHLRGNPGACLAVVMQAGQWRMNAYNLAQKSYLVNDQIAYEAQVLAAVILSSGVFKQRPDYTFTGESEERVCTIEALMSDGSTITHPSPKFQDITPKRSPLWKSDPDQQQGYYTIRAMARRHFPDLLLGIYDVEELQYAESQGGMKTINPKDNPLNDGDEAPAIEAPAKDNTATVLVKSDQPEEPSYVTDVEP